MASSSHGRETKSGASPLTSLTRLTFFTAFEPQKFVHVAVREPQNLWSLLL